ncbi:hypothetical protein J4226_03295 [Candidatus Pacearchaeota archaeon]|nr:hypothetical protein [Candidatus Pacearchaeota archaeon]
MTDHVVYVDAKALEMEALVSGEKSMIIRGATGRKLPYGRVDVGDGLYFIRNNGEGLIRAWGRVTSVFNSEELSEIESFALVEDNMEELALSDAQKKKWGGKRYLVLIGVGKVKEVKPFEIDKSEFGNMDDWLIVGDIERVKV